MKKHLLKLICFTVVLFAHITYSQTIPNANFENWNSVTYNEPLSWSTSNLGSIYRSNVVTTSTVSGFSGKGIRMETKVVGSDTTFGFALYGSDQGDPASGQGGLPYSQKPTNFQGYYRYNLPVNDTALMLIVFKKNGIVISNDIFKIRGTGAQNTFIAFNYSLSLVTSTVTPDSVVIAMASSNAIDNIGVQNGSFLEIDQISFTGSGITEPILNGDFESWVPNTLNFLNDWDNSVNGITRVSGQSGAYAVQLATTFNTGNVEQSLIAIGKPYTQQVDTLFGYYKFTGSSDSAQIMAYLSNLGNFVGYQEKYLTYQPNWTLFSFPISSFSVPDTVFIAITSSSTNSLTAVGSRLQIDNLWLKSQPNTSSIKTNILLSGLSIFPNPSNNYITLDLNSNHYFKSEIVDVKGRKINVENISDTNKQLKFNIEDLPKGVYFIGIEDENGRNYYKFLKD